MKIAITATHGAGKTEFAKALAKAINGNYIHDIVREEVIPKGVAINENTPADLQLWLAAQQWFLETTTKEPWVADKCLYDYLVYGKIVIKDEEIMAMVEKFIERNANYDFVFYLPVEFPMEEDGFRSKDLQPVVDATYKEFLDEKNIKYITLTGSVNERVEQALKHIRK